MTRDVPILKSSLVNNISDTGLWPDNNNINYDTQKTKFTCKVLYSFVLFPSDIFKFMN